MTQPTPEPAAARVRIGVVTEIPTDAVAPDGQRRVVAASPDHTLGPLHWARRGDPRGAGEIARRRATRTFRSCGFTTLATNAVVENRFSSICTILVGFDERMVERSLRRGGGGVVVRVAGGHDATGEEAEPLDEAAVDAAVAEFGAQVEAFAVASMFSVRNPSHERRVRERIRAACGKPVTCSHELSSQLDAPKRALTAALNARLTPQIAHLLEALRRVLERESITAPVMIVKGDGTLMRAEVALEYPVETVLSGPAASVVGAGFLARTAGLPVADMGGTTTDVAIVLAGRPIVRAEGAVIGGWRTMIEAIDVHTCGLGGDSEVSFDRERRLAVGPRKTMPLSLLATRFPEGLGELTVLAAEEYPPPHAAQFAYRNPGRDPGAILDRGRAPDLGVA
jgi:N-methylhydantoinase A/oxoprolinase/acetone carboxylase beta subunit